MACLSVTSLSAAALRRELSYRSLKYAQRHPHELTYGSVPSVIFSDDLGVHGNFEPASYQAILQSEDWCRRLQKTYTAGKWVPRRWDRSRSELDCANSSDALLMNIFCHPGVLVNSALRSLLGIDCSLRPVFGFKPRIPLNNGRTDQTEVDMRLGHLLLEAKLTEGSFQSAPIKRVLRYENIEEVFDIAELSMRNDLVESYQLIRGALAAQHTGQSFVVLCDARRTDLIERWFKIIRAVHLYELRSRLAVITWQEISRTLPSGMQSFLTEKYGISGN